MVGEGEPRIDVGGRRFELISTPGGETVDSTVVHLPDERLAFTGNLFGPLFPHFPNFNTIRGDKYRYAEAYLASLDVVRKLELDEIELPFRIQMERPPREEITPAAVLEQIRADIRNTESVTVELTKDLSEFADLTRLKQWLKEERAARRRMPANVGDFDIPF